MLPREFVCIDCKAHVFSYAPNDLLRDRCYNCNFIHGLELAPETEAELRRVLGCELSEKADDEALAHLREDRDE